MLHSDFSPKVAIVGAGIAGTTAALHLAHHGVTVDLFERETSIFKGSSAIPAHLYSGAQYFHELSKESIARCMSDAIELAKTLSFCVNPRPAVIAIAKKDCREPADLEQACLMNQRIYKAECKKDPKAQVFGDPDRFFKKYSYDQVQQLIQASEVPDDDRWVVSFAQNSNLDELKFPIFVVNEYGLDMRRAAGYMQQLIEENPRIKLHTSTAITHIDELAKYALVVDASGRNLGALESQLGIKNSRLVDIKMAAIFKLSIKTMLPAVYILGGRGVPSGTSFMSQLCPINPAQDGQNQWLIANITTADCTYVEDGKRANAGFGAVSITKEVCPKAFDVLENKESHKFRLENIKAKLSLRHAPLTGYLQPVTGIAGSVDILGENILGRDSMIDAHVEKRFISLNIAKAGASVGVSKALLLHLQQHASEYKIQLEKVHDLVLVPKDLTNAEKYTQDRFKVLGIPEHEARTYAA